MAGDGLRPVTAAVAARAPAIARASLTLRQDRAAGTTVAGSQALLRRLVDKVVDNAIVHNQRAGWIAVATQAGPGTARIVVENGGPMLDQAEVGQLVQPFRRLGADRIAAGRGQASGCRSSRPRSPPTAASSTCGQGPVRRVAARDGRLLELSVKELGVLEALLRASPAFLRAEDLLEQVWDEYADPFTNTVTVTIGRLRRKLGDPPVISTTPGAGYRIADPAG